MTLRGLTRMAVPVSRHCTEEQVATIRCSNCVQLGQAIRACRGTPHIRLVHPGPPETADCTYSTRFCRLLHPAGYLGNGVRHWGAQSGGSYTVHIHTPCILCCTVSVLVLSQAIGAGWEAAALCRHAIHLPTRLHHHALF